MPTEPTPTQQEINDWNAYLKYFNERVRTDGISDEDLDKGDGRYSQEQFAKFAMENGKNYDYPSMTRKMQAHYNALYNSPDTRISEGIRKYYPKSELSPVDGRIGSYTRNYYIPSVTRFEAEKDSEGNTINSKSTTSMPLPDGGMKIVAQLNQ